MMPEEYIKVFDNGLAHISSAQLLAENNEYGFAVSHLILGMEELIKYHVILYHSADDTAFEDKEVNPTNNKSIFRNHSTKHSLLKEFVEASSKEFVETYQQVQFNKLTGISNDEIDLEVFNNRFRHLGGFLRVAYEEINISDIERLHFLQWLDIANDQKNDGFYVDSMYNTPREITKQDFEISSKFAHFILKSIEVVKDLNTDNDSWIKEMNS